MPVPARMTIVTLGVADLERATAFYRRLGWEPAAASNEQITFIPLANGPVLSLYPYEHLAADAQLEPGARQGFGGVTFAINVATEDEVTSTVVAALEAGGSLLKQPQRAEWGGFSGYFADPDGYPWEVAHNPFMPLDADGRGQL